jgi:hypothetical protein
MELLGHSIEHFNGSSDLDRKLVILHLANAVELLLKDLLLDRGESIYKNPKETITIQGAIEQLKGRGVSLPHLNKIELLMDERNALQHRYGALNELTTIFYMDASMNFFRSMLTEQYHLDFDEVLKQFVDEHTLERFLSREPKDDSEFEKLRTLSSSHPLGAFLGLTAYLEKSVRAFFSRVRPDEDWEGHPYWIFMSGRRLRELGVDLSPGLIERLDSLRRMRNLVAHGRGEPSKGDIIRAIETVEQLEATLKGAKVLPEGAAGESGSADNGSPNEALQARAKSGPRLNA